MVDNQVQAITCSNCRENSGLGKAARHWICEDCKVNMATSVVRKQFVCQSRRSH